MNCSLSGFGWGQPQAKQTQYVQPVMRSTARQEALRYYVLQVTLHESVSTVMRTYMLDYPPKVIPADMDWRHRQMFNEDEHAEQLASERPGVYYWADWHSQGHVKLSFSVSRRADIGCPFHGSEHEPRKGSVHHCPKVTRLMYLLSPLWFVLTLTMRALYTSHYNVLAWMRLARDFSVMSGLMASETDQVT